MKFTREVSTMPMTSQRCSRPLPAVWLACLALAACKSGPQVVSLPPPEVAVSVPVRRDVTEYFETTGRVAAVETVEIRARVSGYLDKVNFIDGSEVKAGVVLFEIDPRPYEIEVRRAEGDLLKWNAQSRNAESDVARILRLLPKGAASERELETGIAKKETAAAEILAATARLQDAKLDLTFSRVVAPISGASAGRWSRPATSCRAAWAVRRC